MLLLLSLHITWGDYLRFIKFMVNLYDIVELIRHEKKMKQIKSLFPKQYPPQEKTNFWDGIE